ncbi:hypothetical protein RRSWK_03823 [Rhodopirellula sp. SWK7]|nr:hypothetical protein RRSWK_03823 [Rhodopirellula sp. SWK7]
MRRNPLGHIKELCKPLLLCIGKPCNRNKVICSCDDRTDGHEQDINQWVNGFSRTRVRDCLELLNQRSGAFHGKNPKRVDSPGCCEPAAQSRTFAQLRRLPGVAQSPCHRLADHK